MERGGQGERNENTSQAPPPGDGAGVLGVPGTRPKEDVSQTGRTAPIGVPTEPDGISPGSVVDPSATTTADVPTSRGVLGTPGNLGPSGASPAHAEGGTPGTPDTPTPVPLGGQLTSHEVAGTAGPQAPSGADENLGGTSTPDGSN